jgi:hypothetical protein
MRSKETLTGRSCILQAALPPQKVTIHLSYEHANASGAPMRGQCPLTETSADLFPRLVLFLTGCPLRIWDPYQGSYLGRVSGTCIQERQAGRKSGQSVSSPVRVSI